MVAIAASQYALWPLSTAPLRSSALSRYRPADVAEGGEKPQDEPGWPCSHSPEHAPTALSFACRAFQFLALSRAEPRYQLRILHPRQQVVATEDASQRRRRHVRRASRTVSSNRSQVGSSAVRLRPYSASYARSQVHPATSCSSRRCSSRHRSGQLCVRLK